MIELQLWEYLFIMSFAVIGSFKFGTWVGDLVIFVTNKFVLRGESEK